MTFFCVNFKYLFPALQIGKFNGYAAVETAGTRQRGVERLGAVRRGEDYNARVALKSVHFGQKLVQRLLAFVVSANARVALAADRVDLVDENDAGGFLLRLLEQVADF